MHETLIRGGFVVSSIFDTEGQILDLVLSSPPINYIRFSVCLPEGWSLVEGYNGYSLLEPYLLFLLDSNGCLRGHIRLDENGPQVAELYCRYMVPLLPGFCNFPMTLPRDHIADIVVDRTGVDYKKPYDFPVVPFHDFRPEGKSPDGPICLSDAEMKSLRKSMKKDAARVRAGRPRLDLPIYRWLHENYPDWRDPFAYW